MSIPSKRFVLFFMLITSFINSGKLNLLSSSLVRWFNKINSFVRFSSILNNLLNSILESGVLFMFSSVKTVKVFSFSITLESKLFLYSSLVNISLFIKSISSFIVNSVLLFLILYRVKRLFISSSLILNILDNSKGVLSLFISLVLVK